MTTLTEDFHNGGFIVSQAENTRSKDQITILSGQNLKAGTVLGKLLNATSAPVWTAGGSNTGNGAMGAIVASAGAIVGTYTLEITTAAANAGEFDVYDPNGVHVGQGKVGVAFSKGGLAFTLADGSSDFVVGDTGTIVVAANAGAGKYVAYDPTAADGSQTAAAILYGATDATSGDKAAVGVMRDAEVNMSELVWGAGVTTGQHKTNAFNALAVQGVIGR